MKFVIAKKILHYYGRKKQYNTRVNVGGRKLNVFRYILATQS